MKTKHWSMTIAYLNLFLSILIVAMHINFDPTRCEIMPFGRFYLSANQFIGVIADCAVPAFFTVSAYLAFRNYEVRNYRVFLKKKVKSLAVPYLLWSLLGFIFGQVLAVIKHEPFGNLQDIIMATYNPPIWFIRTLMIFMLLSPAFYVVCKNKIVSTGLIIGFTLKNTLIGGGYSTISYWIPMLLLGGILAIHYKTYVEKERVVKSAVLLILVILTLATVLYGYETFGSNKYYVYRSLSSILIILLMWSVNWKKAPSSWLQQSFFTFCMHALLLGVFQKVFISIFDYSGLTYLLGHLLCIIILWATTIVTAAVLKKYLFPVYSLLSGNRKTH